MTQTQAVNGASQGLPSDVRERVASYTGFHDEQAGGTVGARTEGYAHMVRSYYDLVTDIYERGWGESFHFAPRVKGEPFVASIQRHQHYIASRLGLVPGMRALDVGCGVGGPMREIARFSGAEVVGVNNNGYQVGKARRYNQKARLDHLCQLVESDFMNLPQPDESFDAVYAFEATCHAPDKTALFRELFRVLKPGGKIALYEWCLTDRYDADNPAHRAIKKDIELGNGLPDIWSMAETRACFEEAGFTVLDELDKAHDLDQDVPWYHSLTGEEWSNTGLRRAKLGQQAVRLLTRTLETLKVAPKGTHEISTFLNAGADALVDAGRTGCFTPMAFYLAEKPSN